MALIPIKANRTRIISLIDDNPNPVITNLPFQKTIHLKETRIIDIMNPHWILRKRVLAPHLPPARFKSIPPEQEVLTDAHGYSYYPGVY